MEGYDFPKKSNVYLEDSESSCIVSPLIRELSPYSLDSLKIWYHPIDLFYNERLKLLLEKNNFQIVSSPDSARLMIERKFYSAFTKDVYSPEPFRETLTITDLEKLSNVGYIDTHYYDYGVDPEIRIHDSLKYLYVDSVLVKFLKNELAPDYYYSLNTSEYYQGFDYVTPVRKWRFTLGIGQGIQQVPITDALINSYEDIGAKYFGANVLDFSIKNFHEYNRSIGMRSKFIFAQKNYPGFTVENDSISIVSELKTRPSILFFGIDLSAANSGRFGEILFSYTPGILFYRNAGTRNNEKFNESGETWAIDFNLAFKRKSKSNLSLGFQLGFFAAGIKKYSINAKSVNSGDHKSLINISFLPTLCWDIGESNKYHINGRMKRLNAETYWRLRKKRGLHLSKGVWDKYYDEYFIKHYGKN